MKFLKKLLSPLAKAEIKGLHYAHDVAMFFGFLPLIDSETSGRPRGPFLETWKKGFDAVETGFAYLQVGQMRILGKMGILDADFIGREAENYLHELDHRGRTKIESNITRVINMNAEGTLTDLQAARFLDEAAQAPELAFEYYPEQKQFQSVVDLTDDIEDMQQVVWDKMTVWALAKSESISKMDEATQKKMAVALTRVFQDIPLLDSENGSVVLGERSAENNLCAIFKKAVNAKGEPLAATENHADFLPGMLDWVENDPEYLKFKEYLTRRGHGDDDRIREHEDFARFLRSHGDKKKPGPSV